ncbi:hypothetical protein JCM1841_006654 [Sporobolomyces salmonicolor]
MASYHDQPRSHPYGQPPLSQHGTDPPLPRLQSTSSADWMNSPAGGPPLGSVEGAGATGTVRKESDWASGWEFRKGGAIHIAATVGEDQLAKQFGAASELVKVTGKSCASCRARKVKCDRRFPECARCIKRKESCDYGDDISIALRPVWVVNSDENSDSSTQRAPATTQSPRQPYSRASPSVLPYPLRQPAEAEPSRSLRTISDISHQIVRRQGGQGATDEKRESFQQLWDAFLRQSNLGESSTDWRLALPLMASSLTVHLIDASIKSCCFHLPAFHIFSPNIQFYKEHIDTLDLQSRVVVGILASLGARASPHSALLGVAGPDIENGEASHELVLTAGMRRENAWRAIVKQATKLCSELEVLQVPSPRNAQTLVAFVQMLMLAETKPRTARFFLRTALGLFYDMQAAESSDEDIHATKLSVGRTLVESDSRIAAYLSMPVLISESDLLDYFEGTGVHLPDLATEDLSPQLEAILEPAQGLITRSKLDRALALTGYFVCAVQRLFATISSGRRQTTQFLKSIPQLWTYIDRTHAAVQKFHRRLVQLDYTPEGCDTHKSVDYDLLIGVRMDERLLDIVHLMHEWLYAQRKASLSPEDRQSLEELLVISDRRVRKCLKLLAFYSKVFVDSLDKHVVYHLFTQLEALPKWATMVPQREGEMTEFGPLTAECVLTETELDWFTKALEVACFYTPLASTRLQELTSARNARRRNEDAPYMAFGDYNLSVEQGAAPPSTSANPSAIFFTSDMPSSDRSPPAPASQASSRGFSSNFPSGDDPARFLSNGTSGSPAWMFEPYGSAFLYAESPIGQPPSNSSSGQSAAPFDLSSSRGSNSLSPDSDTISSLHTPQGQPGLAHSRQPSAQAPFILPDQLPSQMQQGQRPGQGAGGNPGWLSNFDFSAMLSAEAARTGTTPGASITELPPDDGAAGVGAREGMGGGVQADGGAAADGGRAEGFPQLRTERQWINFGGW